MLIHLVDMLVHFAHVLVHFVHILVNLVFMSHCVALQWRCCFASLRLSLFCFASLPYRIQQTMIVFCVFSMLDHSLLFSLSLSLVQNLIAEPLRPKL